MASWARNENAHIVPCKIPHSASWLPSCPLYIIHSPTRQWTSGWTGLIQCSHFDRAARTWSLDTREALSHSLNWKSLHLHPYSQITCKVNILTPFLASPHTLLIPISHSQNTLTPGFDKTPHLQEPGTAQKSQRGEDEGWRWGSLIYVIIAQKSVFICSYQSNHIKMTYLFAQLSSQHPI